MTSFRAPRTRISAIYLCLQTCLLFIFFFSVCVCVCNCILFLFLPVSASLSADKVRHEYLPLSMSVSAELWCIVFWNINSKSSMWHTGWLTWRKPDFSEYDIFMNAFCLWHLYFELKYLKFGLHSFPLHRELKEVEKWANYRKLFWIRFYLFQHTPITLMSPIVIITWVL